MILKLSQVRDWLKSFDIAENYYIGKLDNKKEKAIGVYSLNRPQKPVIAIGGAENSTYKIKSVSVLIRWNKNADETETAAFSLYEELLLLKSFYIDSVKINFIKLRVSEPIDVGTDEKGVYERVIEFDLYYERNE